MMKGDAGGLSEQPLWLPNTNAPEYIHNRIYSHLYRLPVEIHFLIGEFLPPTAIISLRLAGRHFHSVFRNPDQKDINHAEREYFLKLKSEDNYQWNVRRERYLRSNLNCSQDKITCSRCRCLHPITAFSSHMVTQDPNRRLCIGAQGRISLCKHQTFSFDELQELRSNNKSPVVTTDLLDCRTCTHPEHGTSGPELSLTAPFIGISKREGAHEQELIIMSQSWGLLKTRKDEYIAPSKLEASLHSIGEQLCPHTSISDVTSWIPSAKMLVDQRQYPFSYSRSDDNGPSCDVGACRQCTTLPSYCPKPCCDTSWVIFKRHGRSGEGVDELVLCATRRIGSSLKDGEVSPMNKSWLAQIEEEIEQEGEMSGCGLIQGGKEEVGFKEVCMDGKQFMERFKGQNVDPWVLFFRAQGMSECYMGPMKRDLQQRRITLL